MHLCVEFLDVNCHTCRCKFTQSAESEPEGFLTMIERAVQTFFFYNEWDFQTEKKRFHQKHFCVFQFILKPVSNNFSKMFFNR